MIRVVLLNLLLLFLPTLLYFAYAGLVRQFQPQDKPVPDAPLVWLVVTGAILMVAGLIIFGSWDEAPRQGIYVPAHVRDGKVVPAHVE